MDFRLSAGEQQLRDDIRDWLERELDPAFREDRGALSGARWEYALAFNRKLAEKRWLVPAWPREYGGLGVTPLEYAIIQEELYYARAPIGLNVVRAGHAGPTIMAYGTDEQKRQHLPPIARGETVWCQGFSEPGAGSDLASLQTRAVRSGDVFVINGQKIWTSRAHLADWMILLARTNPEVPKHKGITCFLVDMKSPGIEVRPLHSLDGGHHFNEVYFNDLEVPVTSVLGEVDRGWYVATTQLDFERSAASRVGVNRRGADDLMEDARSLGAGRLGSSLRYAIADAAVSAEVGRLLCYRVAGMQTAGLVPNAEASMAKLFNSELWQRIAGLGVRLLRMAGQAAPSNGLQPTRDWRAIYLDSVSTTIGGGTSEVQRNILATRGLGLPR